AAIREGERKNIRTLLAERVLRPIGVSDEEWSVGYNRTFTVDGLPLVASWGGGGFTARALARIGRLILREGDWDGRRVLSREAARQITGDAGLPGHCGMGWWTNAAGRYAKLPKDAVWGAGAGDQVLLVIPSLNLIMVRNGQTIEPPPPDAPDVFAAYHDPRAKILFEPLVEAIMDKRQPAGKALAPPRSPVIKEIRWAPPETIVRKAKGSDNWPMTWADDDALYTAYGDGNGFGPLIAEKLSLGFTKVTGAPPYFNGENLRSPKNRIHEREAYEFFAGLDEAGQPTWTRDLARRAAVITNPGRCYRNGVTYNAALRRYLLVHPVSGAASRDRQGNIDVRFSGGLAIYEAPEPWGPWTTAFFAERWDAGPGDAASFPTKWMGADGRTLYLVFSGDDSFSVRKATLTLN